MQDEAVSAIYDKTGREIMQGDIVKVFHFVGARKKRHYMYKQVVEERRPGKGQNPYWFFSHLSQREDDGYLIAKDGKTYHDYEIVQSVDFCFEDRPRKAARAALSAALEKIGAPNVER